MSKLLKSAYVSLVNFKSRIHYKLRHILKTFTLKGIILSIDDDTALSKDVLLSVLQGGYEDKENRVIRKNLHTDDIVLELGAGLGFNSITAAKINKGKIVAYEANPGLIPLIKRNQQLNNIDFEVRNRILVNAQNMPGKISFHIAGNICMSSSKKIQSEEFVHSSTEMIETEFTGDVIRNLSPTFLIVDIEGGEEDLFNEPSLIKNSSIKKILVEVHPEIIGDKASTAVIKNITEAGFDMITGYSTDSVLFFRRS